MLPVERGARRTLLSAGGERMNIRTISLLTTLGLLPVVTLVWAADRPSYIECSSPRVDGETQTSGSVWTFALLTEPRPKLLERIETGLGEVRLLGRLRSLSKAETAFVNERGARNVTIWEAETAASITGKADTKFYTFDTCTTLWACRNSFRFSRQDLSLWVAHGKSRGSPANWQNTSYECRFIEREQFRAALDGARAQMKLNAEIEQEVLGMRGQANLF